MHVSSGYDPSPTPPGPLPAIKTPPPGTLPALPSEPMDRLDRIIARTDYAIALARDTLRLMGLNDADDRRGA